MWAKSTVVSKLKNEVEWKSERKRLRDILLNGKEATRIKHTVWILRNIVYDVMKLHSTNILHNKLQPLQQNGIDDVDVVGVNVAVDGLDNVDGFDDDDDDVGDEKTVNDGKFGLLWSVLNEFGALITNDGNVYASHG